MMNSSGSMYIYNMPYQKLESLGRILDNKETWKTLGGLMQYDTQTIQEFERAERQGKSPTIELLNNWSKQNHTVIELFTLLYKMKHFQAMMVLKPLVDEKYHQYIYEGKHHASGLSDEVAGVCGPSSTNPSGAVALGVVDDKTLAYGQHNWNVMAPEAAKLSKQGFPDSQPKIQNNRSPISIEENNLKPEKIPVSPTAQAAVGTSTPLPLGIRKVGLEKLRLSPVGIAVLAAGQQSPCPPNSALNQNHLAPNVPNPSTQQRKLSDASGASPSEWSTLPQCDYKDLEAATQNWSRSCILGRGGFGTVFVGNWKNTKVAIKRLELPKGQTRESQEVQIQQSLTELSVLQSIRHDNILQLYGFSLGGNHPCLVYQYMENGSLEDCLQSKDNKIRLDWHQRYNIAKGTAKGVQYLHTVLEKPLIHGDIKSANILLDSNFEPRIGDFGLAREGPQVQYTHMEVSRVHGTKPYLPVEFLRSKKLSTKVDTYSFGVVLFELTTGQRAYEEKRTNKYLKDEVTSRPNDKLFELMDLKAGNSCVEYFEPMIKLGIRCVADNFKQRPEMEEVWKILDQYQAGGKGQPSPFELQVRYDQWSQQRRQSQSHTPQVLTPAGNSNSPARNKLAVSQSTSSHPSSVCPPNVSVGVSQGPSQASGQRTPSNAAETSRVAGPRANNIPPQGQELFSPAVIPASLHAPFPSPTISILPATGSGLSTTSQSSEDSSVYSSHASQNVAPHEWEIQSGEEGPGDIPLLSVLGTLPSPPPRTISNPMK